MTQEPETCILTCQLPTSYTSPMDSWEALGVIMLQHKLVCTTQVNSTFRARWLASSEVISQVLFTSEQPTKTKRAFVGILSQIKLLFGPLVIQLVWYILKQLFTEVEVNSGGYLPSRRRSLSRDLTHIRRRWQGRRLVKNVFIFYFGISHLIGTIQCVCRY